MQERQIANDWKSYWERLEGSQYIFRMEALDYVTKLERSFPLTPNSRVFDFGCGFGMVADLLADRVGEIYLWDQAENMRERARTNLEGKSNVSFLDIPDPKALSKDLKFDLILVNSVVQYMSPDQFDACMSTWATLLDDHGRIVVSDLIPRKHRPLSDVAAMLALGVREKFLLRCLAEGVAELGSYWRMRNMHPLTRWDRGELCNAGAAAGLKGRFLDENLTYRPSRLTAVFTAA